MALIDDIKQRINVFYSEVNNDAKIQGMIDEAKLFLKGAGWDVGSAPNAEAIGIIARYVLHVDRTEPTSPTNDPHIVSAIARNKVVVEDEV